MSAGRISHLDVKAGSYSLMEYSKIELRLNSVVGYLAGETEEQRQLEILGTDIA